MSLLRTLSQAEQEDQESSDEAWHRETETSIRWVGARATRGALLIGPFGQFAEKVPEKLPMPGYWLQLPDGSTRYVDSRRNVTTEIDDLLERERFEPILLEREGPSIPNGWRYATRADVERANRRSRPRDAASFERDRMEGEK